MIGTVALAVFLSVFAAAIGQQVNGACKDPTVAQRRMSDDVRFASPFYVIALPKTPQTEQIDNVCYTYYESKDGAFFHIMSIVYQNGSNTFYNFKKGDISDRTGLAQSRSNVTSCVYNDYTLTPICDVSVFILYRCFIDGNCNEKIDIGATPGVDVRLALAASTEVNEECQRETLASLNDKSNLVGGEYFILPQLQKPQCVTTYGNKISINAAKALGFLIIPENDIIDRFGDDSDDSQFFSVTPSSASASAKPAVVFHKPESIPNKPAKPVDLSAFYKPVVVPQQTPEVNIPKRTYAEVVKTPSTFAANKNYGSNKNIVPLANHNWKSVEVCGCA